jgi:hypothetical protein
MLAHTTPAAFAEPRPATPYTRIADALFDPAIRQTEREQASLEADYARLMQSLSPEGNPHG